MGRVKDNVIIVTGAASGLGLADAAMLARETSSRSSVGTMTARRRDSIVRMG